MVEAGTDSVSVLRQDCLACVKNSEVAGAAGVGGRGEGRGSVEQVTARRELSFLQEERLRVRETTSPRSPSHIRRWHSQE